MEAEEAGGSHRYLQCSMRLMWLPLVLCPVSQQIELLWFCTAALHSSHNAQNFVQQSITCPASQHEVNYLSVGEAFVFPQCSPVASWGTSEKLRVRRTLSISEALSLGITSIMLPAVL